MALRGAVIGVLHQAYDRNTDDPEVLRVFRTALEDLRRAGAIVIDPAGIDGFSEIRRPQNAGPCMGFKYDINRWLAARADRLPVKDLADVIKSGRFHPSVQRRLEQAQNGVDTGPESPSCKADDAYREQVREAVVRTMERLKLDAFVYPTWSNPPRLMAISTTPAGDNSQLFSPTTGFPAINVPMGFTRDGTLPAV